MIKNSFVNEKRSETENGTTSDVFRCRTDEPAIGYVNFCKKIICELERILDLLVRKKFDSVKKDWLR
jgi:hypothetical protein